VKPKATLFSEISQNISDWYLLKAGFLVDLFFGPRNRGNMFQGKVGLLLSDNMAFHRRETHLYLSDYIELRPKRITFKEIFKLLVASLTQGVS
jgi:hypothetical protein